MEDWKIREDAFLGKVTAGATHELRNVLAIIGESAGLVEDIIRLRGPDGRIESKLALVKEQIARGQLILGALNRYAHSADHPVETLDLKQSIEDMIVLSRRFLRQKNIDCLIDRADQVVVRTCPVKWNMIHFALLMSYADDLPSGTVIRIACNREDKGATVTFRSTPEEKVRFASLSGLLEDSSFRRVMDEIGVRAEIKEGVRTGTCEIGG
ncbi:HAMP domain-containing histidine kinase [Thermodesulforhabdus norvegica]|uniref:His Kinase A (Phospho-acceptor) domain-containing protein n=1 Tax=Thermodesulforhabdus norvegica TaxID=39841 RepID=A0A1I4SGP2_9BACT|nr:HAMP domain-containing histidine kinase [Thermodesulforhabdus norvegica]SFM63658.1 hypothetical protein SAMN05660836_00955 [Thermodesulforhabdus norvegica]